MEGVGGRGREGRHGGRKEEVKGDGGRRQEMEVVSGRWREEGDGDGRRRWREMEGGGEGKLIGRCREGKKGR